ncbi:MAG: SEC-C metal-binding domain-containing protein, partial [Streptosporangiaceae bacterium]
AKEGVKIERENQTLATITFQNYFRMYEKLAGMTGTAETEANEFHSTYKLDLVVIPTNRTLIRLENPDVVYRTEREKFNAVVEEIAECHQRGQPVLVGTISVEKSERVSEQLKKTRVPHVVLNAKFHEKEAEIVAQAGRKGSVTIATNMAGRGTDILLGGNPETLARAALLRRGTAYDALPADERAQALAPFKVDTDHEHDEVVAVGGLHIIGTERHESRRIDNQLRGRAGRQGDPGSSRFYLSLEDDLLRIFGGEKISGLMLRLGMEEGQPIESRLISRRIAAAQEQVEAQHFESRKHLLEYDDVMNKQREAIYGMRHDLLAGLDQKEFLLGVAQGAVEAALDTFCGKDVHPDKWNLAGLRQSIRERFGIDFHGEVPAETLNFQELGQALMDLLQKKYGEKEALIGAPQLRHFERLVMLQIVDNLWKDHLLAMDHLKEGIGLRGYGQRDPLIEYKKESFDMFQDLMERIEDDSLRTVFLARVITQEEQQRELEARREAESAALREYEKELERRKQKQARELRFSGSEPAAAVATVVRNDAKVGRNDPCPCGSGKKFKKCHGAAELA